VTLPITPTIAEAVGVAASAGRARSRLHGHQREHAVDRSTTSAEGTTESAGPTPVGVERHELDEAHSTTPSSRPNRAKSTISSSFTPRLEHHVDLHRVEVRRTSAASDAGHHVGEGVAARVMAAKRSRAQRVEADMFTRRRPAAHQLGAPAVRSREPLVVSERSTGSAGQVLRPAPDQVGPHRGLAPGEADAGERRTVPRTGAPPGARARLAVSTDSLRGTHCMPVGRHAVRAAEVAPVGDRDAQVSVDPPEAVDQRCGVGLDCGGPGGGGHGGWALQPEVELGVRGSPAERTRAPAGLLPQGHLADGHRPVGGLAHVVDGERGHRAPR
jgi:hypothetical protein